jgi:hypothetical protein
MPFRKDDHTVGNIGIVNVGRMPASHLRLFVDMKVHGNGRLDDFPINEERLFGNNILPPGTTMLHSMNFIFSGFEYDHVRSGSAYLYVWGIVRYLDGFGQERFTRFCHRYTGTGYFHFREGIHAGKEALLAESGRYHEYGNDAD